MLVDPKEFALAVVSSSDSKINRSRKIQVIQRSIHIRF